MSDMSDTPYRWRLAAQAVLRYAKIGQLNIEDRIPNLLFDKSRQYEYRLAKSVWEELRRTEVAMEQVLNGNKKGERRTMENWITVESFGADVPANWEEIAAYLNDVIKDRGIECDHAAVNDVWEAFWQGEFADAPVVE